MFCTKKLQIKCLFDKEREKVSKDRGSFDQNSLDRNCVFSVDRKFHNQLTNFFKTFHLIKKFDQLPKSVGSFLAVDRMYCWLRNRAKN
jgi:hypothetical protein